MRPLNRASLMCLALIGSSSLLMAQNFPLKFYNGDNATGNSGGCYTVKTLVGNAIPGGMNNKINSLRLRRGFAAVVGVNNDCVGVSKFYSAPTRDRIINLPDHLKNKISFIRAIRLDETTTKKGLAGGSAASARNSAVAAGATWYYAWNNNLEHIDGLEYVPMKWRGNNNEANRAVQLGAKNFSHMLTYNEPDHHNQANMTVARAIELYPLNLRSGLRMGSPVVTQDGFRRWLSDFMDETRRRDYRVDFLAMHWYDWGNQNNNNNSGEAIRRRMTSKITNQRRIVGGTNTGMAVWLTEFNANPNRRDDNIQGDFIAAAGEYIDRTSWFERYSVFRSRNANFGPANNLRAAGIAFRDAPTRQAPYLETNNKGW